MSGGRGWLLPREHGAWGMLLQPFAAAAILAGEWTPAVAVGLVAALTVFLMREPLLVLARQRWVWREVRPESAKARFWLAWEVAVTAACGAYLWRELPRGPLAGLGAVAAGMTFLGLAAMLANRQRSVALQVAMSASLSSSSLLAALAATSRLPSWGWQLWALLTFHSVTAIFVVHARLAARTKEARRTFRAAVWTAAVQLAAAVVVILASGAALAAPMLFSVAVNAFELRRLRTSERLTRVGFRTLTFSLLHTGIAIAVLWPAARTVELAGGAHQQKPVAGLRGTEDRSGGGRLTPGIHPPPVGGPVPDRLETAGEPVRREHHLAVLRRVNHRDIARLARPGGTRPPSAARPSDASTLNVRCARGLPRERSSQMKNGPPRMPVTTPTVGSAGAGATQATVSHSARKAAPSR